MKQKEAQKLAIEILGPLAFVRKLRKCGKSDRPFRNCNNFSHPNDCPVGLSGYDVCNLHNSAIGQYVTIEGGGYSWEEAIAKAKLSTSARARAEEKCNAMIQKLLRDGHPNIIGEVAVAFPDRDLDKIKSAIVYFRKQLKKVGKKR